MFVSHTICIKLFIFSDLVHRDGASLNLPQIGREEVQSQDVVGGHME